MIWFACRQCGKRHGRAEDAAGTLVFCECGQGNRVPWTSTAPEPDPADQPPPPVPTPSVPRWTPQPREDDWAPAPQPPPLRHPRQGRRPDPSLCLNHDTPSEKICDDCRCHFCSACVVRLQERTLCGPCKNFRIRGLHRHGRTSPLSIIALIVALIGGPVCFVLTMMAVGMQVQTDSRPGPVGFCLVALILPAAGLVLGSLALRDVETGNNVGGRSLAATGTAAGLAGVIWTFSVAVLILAK
jgi:hypothetical protein